MRFSRFIAVAASALLAFSTVTADAGTARVPPHTSSGHGTATAVWIIFGCAGSVVFAAIVKNASQRQQLTALEAQTCGLAYWFNPQNYRGG
jgi:hypothetical protein